MEQITETDPVVNDVAAALQHQQEHLAKMRLAAEATSGILRALAHQDRLLLLCQMTQGEKSVGELESLLDLHQPSLSQQLGVLRIEGLVTTRRDGKRIFYSIADPKLLQILSTLFELYCPDE